jgi:O-antigen ligase
MSFLIVTMVLALVLGVVRALHAAALLPARLDEALIAGLFLVLPSAPYLNELSANLGTTLRFGLAGLLLLSIALGCFEFRVSQNPPAVALIAFQVLACVMAPVTTYGAVRLANWVMFSALGLVRYSSRQLRMMVAYLLVGGGLLVGGVALQVAGAIGGTWGGLKLTDGYATRYTSFLENPNDLGLYLVIAAAVCYVVAPKLWLALLGTTALGLGVLLAQSRGALLAIPLLASVLLVGGRPKRVVLLAVVGTCVFLLLPTVVPSARSSRDATIHSLGAVLAGRDKSAQDRQSVWSNLGAAQHDLVLGDGYGGYVSDQSLLAANFDQRRATAYTEATADNSWLKLWLEEGVLGLSLMALMLAFALKRAWATRKTAGLGLACALLVFVWRSFSADIFDINPWNAYLWLAVGVAATLAAGGNVRRGAP